MPFFNHVIYLGVIFDKRITWKLHLEMTEAKAFRTFIRVYSLFKHERLSANIKLTLYKALIRSVIRLSRLGISDRHLSLKIAAHAKQGSAHNWTFSKAHTGPRFAHSFQHSVYIWLYKKLRKRQAKVIQNHENKHVHSIGQGEARHRKYKRLILGGGQTYDRSNDTAAIVV
jgi:hypothetical protein